MTASDASLPEPQEDALIESKLKTLCVSVPLTSDRTPESIIATIETSLGVIMSTPANLVLGGRVPFRPHWYSLRKTYMSSWTFTVDQIVDRVGTAAVLGALYREFPNCKAEYIQ